MPSPDRSEEPSRNRAVATLGLSPEADASAVRSAFFRKLAAFDFAPPEDWCAAAVRLGAALPLTQSVVEALAEYEWADVEGFLAEYWALSPDARTERWKELDGRCRDRECRAALNRVKEGLSSLARAHNDAAIDEMAEFVRGVYVLPPRESAARRMEWCAVKSDRGSAEALRHAFRRADPEMARLVPELIHEVFSADRIPDDAATEDREALAEREAEDLRRALNTYERASKNAYANSEPRRVNRGVWIAVWVVFVGSLIFVASSGSKNRPASTDHFTARPDSEYSPGLYQRPSQWPKFSEEKSDPLLEASIERNPAKRFTTEQVRQFLAYDPKSGKPEPPDYRLWLYSWGIYKPRSTSPTRK